VWPQAGATARITHSDKVGDPVCMEEARWVLNVLYDALAGQVSNWLVTRHHLHSLLPAGLAFN
jgi:hypothetical protein